MRKRPIPNRCTRVAISKKSGSSGLLLAVHNPTVG
jgi:hypothetical protein